MRTLFNQPFVDKSDLISYPSGRIRNNDGSSNGTRVNEATKGDLHQMLEKLMRLYAITPNELPDSEGNGFQLIEALRGLASKNDFIYPMSTNGTVVSVDIKFSQMLENEFIVCRASFDKGTETQIKGLGATLFTIAYSGSFKTNEYVRVIKTSSGISIIRLSDALSLDAMVSDFSYLKKATQAEENTGVIDTKATTPLTNLVAFTKRVIGADSINFLAIPTGVNARNGLLSSADKLKIDNIGSETIIGTGSVLSDGTKLTERNITFTSTKISTGHYKIIHNIGLTNYGISGGGISIGTLKVAMEARNMNDCVVIVSDDNSPNDGDFAFQFFKL